MIRTVRHALRPLRQPAVKAFRRFFLLPARRVWFRHLPVALITGTKGKTTTCRMLAHILTGAGFRVGLATTDGAVIEGKQIHGLDSSGYGQHGRVMRSPSVSAAVLETARGGLLRHGLYIDRCSAAALLNIGREQIGMDGIGTLEHMAAHKRQVLDASRGAVVLNADDPLCRKLTGEFPARRTLVFSLDRKTRPVQFHLESGGAAYCLDESGEPEIVRLQHGKERSLITIADLPSAWNGIVRHNIANAMAAAALAEGMGVAFETVRLGLSSFHNTLDQSPGRFNVIEGYPFLLILDEACSPPAAAALVACLGQVPVSGRRRCMFTSAGNRPDWHFGEFTAILAKHFDSFVCYELEKYRRGRAPGDIANLLKSGLVASGVNPGAIQVTDNYESALGMVSAEAVPGDLAVILGGPERREIPLVRKAFERHLRLSQAPLGQVQALTAR